MKNNGQTILSKFNEEGSINLQKGLLPYALTMITVDKTGKEIKVGIERICEAITSKKNEIGSKLTTIPTLIGFEPNCDLPDYWKEFPNNSTFNKIYSEGKETLISSANEEARVDEQVVETRVELRNLMYQYNGLVYDYYNLLREEVQCESFKKLGDNQRFKLSIEQCSLLGI